MRMCLAVLMFSSLVTVASPIASAQTTLPSTGNAFSLDVISVKPNHSGERPGNIHTLPDGIRMDNIPLNLLIRMAYGLTYDRQIVGTPEWVKAESFDVEARVAESDLEKFNNLPNDQRTQRIMQTLLAERFKLAVHRETQSMAGYALVVAKGGTKLQPEKTDGSSQRAPYLSTTANRISMHGLSMASLASALTRQTGRAVEDKSGLIGNFDVELHWTPEMSASPMDAAAQETAGADSSDPGLFTALQEQLGLRLESGKVPVECLVVDHIERPAAN